MAGVRMTSLRRAPNGDWFARKMIPEDVLEKYRAAFGVTREARFRLSAAAREAAAKQSFRDWDAEVTSRIERLRADARGEGLASLTHRQAHALSGEWYTWFLVQHEEEPGGVEAWDHLAEEYETSYSKFASPEDDEFDPARSSARETEPGAGSLKTKPKDIRGLERLKQDRRPSGASIREERFDGRDPKALTRPLRRSRDPTSP